MERFVLDSTSKTPKVIFDGKNGKFEISGRSIPENSAKFYSPLMEWIGDYVIHPAEETVINVKLEYFNTSSLKGLIELFRKFEKLNESGKPVKIYWYYEEEDEDMQESGEDFKQLIKIPIELVKI
jgi:hypothetical protein